MKLLKTVRLTGALLAGVLLWVGFGTANAAPIGTPAGTTISNQATVNYTVGTTAQTAIGSSPTGNSSGAGTPTTFKVDNKLVLTVTANDTADVQVSPGTTTAVLSFTVSNQGNATQGISFSTIQEATSIAASTAGAGFTGTSNFQLAGGSVAVFVENGTTVGYQLAQDTAGSIPQLTSGSTAVVYIVATIPTAQLDSDVAIEALVAQVATAGAVATYGTAPGANITSDNSAAAWDSTTTQLIFADAASTQGDGTTDAAHDGKASARDVYIVKSAKLTITKSQQVLADPTGDAIAHAIPGAVIKYTITIANSSTASQPATSISVADALPANTNWGGNTGVSGTTGTGTLTYQSPSVNGGAAFACTDGSKVTKTATLPYTSASCDYNVTTPTTVTISGVYLAPNDTATITYSVTVQ
jgi:hypothetical protein